MNIAATIKKYEDIDLDALCIEAGRKTEKEYLDLQREQMGEGLDAFGNQIGRYSGYTVGKKSGKSGLAGEVGHVTGYDTGGMHQQMFVTIEKRGFTPYSRSGTADEFTEQYGNRVWGLNTPFIGDYQRIFIPALREAIAKKLK